MSRLVGSSLFRAVVAFALVAALTACGGSSEPSGTYEAAMPGGGGVRIEFASGNTAKVTLFGPQGEGELSHNTTYTKDGTKLHFTTDEPMGAPMDLVYENGVLSDGDELVFKKK